MLRHFFRRSRALLVRSLSHSAPLACVQSLVI
jgi:hypothetical protein